MNLQSLRRIPNWFYNLVISVPVRIKIAGIILMTVLTLGLTLNYWVTTGLSDWLSYLLTDVRVEAAMRAGNRSLLLITILAAAGSLVIASFLTYLLTRPLVDLRDMALKVAEGNLDARATVWAKDEIGEVALAINTMTDHLLRTQDDLARELFEEALALAGELESPPAEMSALSSLMRTHIGLGNSSMVLLYADSALRLARSLGDQAAEIGNLNLLTAYLIKQGQFKKLPPFLQRGLEVATANEDWEWQLTMQERLGFTHYPLSAGAATGSAGSV